MDNESSAKCDRNFVMRCQLCLNEFIHPNPIEYSPKLPELCYKYLHSTLTQETIPSKNKKVSFCPKCYESAMQLVLISEQMELLQTSISNLVLTFSLGILHRRGKIPDISDFNVTNDMNSANNVGFDISTCSNSSSWSPDCPMPNPIWTTPKISSPVMVVQKPEEKISASISTEEIVDPLLLVRVAHYDETPDDFAIEVKRETNYQPDYIEEGNIDLQTDIENGITLSVGIDESPGTSGISATRFENYKQTQSFHSPRRPAGRKVSSKSSHHKKTGNWKASVRMGPPKACKGCGIFYSDSRARARCHQRDRGLKGEFSCSECGGTFMRPSLLNRHMNEVHQGGSRRR